MSEVELTQEPPPDLRSYPWLSWLVIAVSVGFIAVVTFRHSVQRPKQTTDFRTPSTRLEITARYVIGASKLLGAAQPPKSAELARKVYTQQLEQYATTPIDRLRLVPVAARLNGADDALDRLKTLEPVLAGTDLAADSRSLRMVYEAGVSELTAQQRTALAERHGWFGRLALAWGKPAEDSTLQSVDRDAMHAFVALLGMACVSGAGIMIGLVLFVFAMVWYADGKVRLAYSRPRVNADIFLEAFAVFVGLYTVISLAWSLLGIRDASRLGGVKLVIGAIAPVVGLAWPLIRGVGVRTWRAGLGWHAGRGLFREMGLGIAGYIAGLPLVALGFVITAAIARITKVDVFHPIINDAKGGAGSAIRLFVLAAVWAPLIEESLFRGALFHSLRARHGWWFSSLLVSLVFASMHPQGWAAIPVLGAIALVFAGIREWRDTIVASAAAHALNNGLLVLVLIFALS